MIIRNFNPTDPEYDAIALVEKAVWPDNFDTAATFKRQDETRDPQHIFQRFVAEQNGRIVAFAHHRHMHWTPQPGYYRINVDVHPDLQRQGIGTAVYDHIMGALRDCHPVPEKLFAYTRADKPHALRFLENRGFSVVMRWIVSILDVTAFRLEDFSALEGKLAAQGLQILALPELAQQDPDCEEKVYEMDWECTLDEPQPVTPQKPTLMQYRKQYLDNPDLLQDAWYVAVDNGRYVGMTQFYCSSAPLTLKSGFTGVVRSHRRRGVATWLKLHGIAYAQKRGIAKIRTGNEEHNPMYALNQQLGYEDLTVTLSLRKEWSSQ